MPRQNKNNDDDETELVVPKRNTKLVNYGEMNEEGDHAGTIEGNESDDPTSAEEDEEVGDVEEDEEEAEDAARQKRPSRRSQTALSKSEVNDLDGSRRTSSRSTKFKASMAEPSNDRDLIERMTSSSVNKKKPPLRGRSVENKRADKDDSNGKNNTKVAAQSRSSARSLPNDGVIDSLGTVTTPHKSPARSHARPRLSLSHIGGAFETDDDGNDNDSSSVVAYVEEGDNDDLTDEEDAEEESDEPPLKVQRILAARTDTHAKWKEVCKTYNTSEVDTGSRWFQKPQTDLDESAFEERFLVKWSDLSYLHCSWEKESDLMEQIDGAKNYLSTFFRKSHNGILFSADERCDGDYFDPAYIEIERVLEVQWPEGYASTTSEEEDRWTSTSFGIVMDKTNPHYEEGMGRQFLIKWGNTPYNDCSYEFERDLILNEIEYKEPVKDFLLRSKKPKANESRRRSRENEEERRKLYTIFSAKSSLSESQQEKAVEKFQRELQDNVYKNGGQVRDYQAEGISWMLSNYVNQRSSILADEMGLGKTLQTVGTVNIMATRLNGNGVFLVIAPLSTLSHWEREFKRWTDLNTIVYHGSGDDRRLIRELEFAYEDDRPKNTVGFNQLYLKKCKPRKPGSGESPWMVQVVITTPEMIVADDFVELTAVDWDAVIVDEAHRLKNHNSKLAINLRDNRFKFDHIILLTGTPIQNDVQEFWTLLNFIDPNGFDDVDKFMTKYGDMKSKERVDELHEEIRPFILRRLKEDVEKSVPPKEETLIEVELTLSQKQYYRALYEKNVKFLHKNNKKALDGPSLNNLAMQLRKCCNHVFLLKGVEEEFRNKGSLTLSEADFLVQGSGKLILLDKLLPRLKSEGHRVLVFSQFKIMLDILEDYFSMREMKFERIDGSITGKRRQQAIDRFQAPEIDGRKPPFIMMLSTRAGGVGINLTAADTCIIFDSDWNPQNDLQAQARCHRIGQTKEVKVYRLLTRKTYEMQMFHMSSMKMGLDQAVLKGFESGSSGEGALTKEEVEKLLRHGAYEIFNEDKAGSAEAESNSFVRQDLDSILQRRSRTVVHDKTGTQNGAAGSTFSKASFKVARTPDTAKGTQEDVDIEDPDFWKKMVGEGQADDVADDFATKRQRKETNYSEKAYLHSLEASLNYSDDEQSDSESDESSSTPLGGEMTKWGGMLPHEWKKDHVDALLQFLLRYGYGHFSPKAILEKFEFGEEHGELETHRMCWAMALTALLETAEDDAVQARKREERASEKKLEVSANADGGTLAVDRSTEIRDKDLPVEELRRRTFSKLWKANAVWAEKALRDAVSYAKQNAPRDQDAIDKALRKRNESTFLETNDISSIFAANVWPSLKSRGWKAMISADGSATGQTRYSFKNEEFTGVETVLKAVKGHHKELSNMVDTIFGEVETQRLNTMEGKENERSEHLALSPTSITWDSLNRFLQKYAPLQLVADRAKAQPVRLPRKLLSTCIVLDMATALVLNAGVVPGDFRGVERLGECIVIDKRTALPHSQWTTRHDAVLIQSILKHGWIDQDSSCHAISDDPEVKWGPPFDTVAKSSEAAECTNKSGSSYILDTSARVAAFLNNHAKLLNEVKGLNVDRLSRTYQLVEDTLKEADRPNVSPESSMTSKSWVVQKVSNDNAGQMSRFEATELPPKKELVKRAKAVLSRFLATFINSKETKAVNAINKSVQEQTNEAFGYTMIDQTQVSNLFLSELLSSILKTPSTKESVQELCSLAAVEARNLFEVAEEKAKHNKVGVSSDVIKEASRILQQLETVDRNFTKKARACKNLIRVMLGGKPQQPRRAGESLFPVEKPKPTQLSTAKTPVIRKPPSRVTDVLRPLTKTSGERAIEAGIKMVADRGSGKPLGLSGLSKVVPLELTEVETMILQTIASYGLPIWSEHWQNSISPHPLQRTKLTRLNWVSAGSHLVSLAESYRVQAALRRDRTREVVEALSKMVADQATTEALSKANHEFWKASQIGDKLGVAFQQAIEYARDAESLAKKAIMMISKVLRLMGPILGVSFTPFSDYGLGTRVLQWLLGETHRWSESLGLLDETQQPLAYTAVDFLQHLGRVERESIEVACVLDKSHCRAIAGQIALLSRLRSVFTTYEGDELTVRVWSAAKSCDKINGKKWERRPDWWGLSGAASEPPESIQHDLLMFERLLESGFQGILETAASFGKRDRYSSLPFSDAKLSKGAIQLRANMLVRELHNVIEFPVSSKQSRNMHGSKNDAGVLNERRNSDGSGDRVRKAATSSGATTSTTTKKQKKMATQQTGLLSFFGAADNDDNSVEIVDPPANARSTSKHTKSNKRKDDDDGSEVLEVSFVAAGKKKRLDDH